MDQGCFEGAEGDSLVRTVSFHPGAFNFLCDSEVKGRRDVWVEKRKRTVAVKSTSRPETDEMVKIFPLVLSSAGMQVLIRLTTASISVLNAVVHLNMSAQD